MKVALSWTVAVKEPGEAVEEIREGVERGFAHYNFKVGSTFEKDEALMHHARQHMPSDAFFWADANQGLEYPQAVRLAGMLQEYKVDVLEQPLAADQMHQMRRLRSQTSIPLAVDESSVSPGDFFAYALENLVDYYVLKLTRSAGIWPTLMQLGVASSAGHGLLVSGLTDSMITKLAACQTAAAFGYAGPSALNGSQFMDDSMFFPDKVKVEQGGYVTLNERPGLGIEPDEASLLAEAWN